jgi:hypothetical protein
MHNYCRVCGLATLLVNEEGCSIHSAPIDPLKVIPHYEQRSQSASKDVA